MEEHQIRAAVRLREARRELNEAIEDCHESDFVVKVKVYERSAGSFDTGKQPRPHVWVGVNLPINIEALEETPPAKKK